MPLETRSFITGGVECSLAVETEGGLDLEQAEREIINDFEALSRFNENSELSKLNSRLKEWQKVSPLMKEMLEKSYAAFSLSQGLVNIAIWDAVVGNGYRDSFEKGPSVCQKTKSVKALKSALELQENEVFLKERIDLGGIAKGILAQIWAGKISSNCVVNLGGDMYVRGDYLGEGWPISVGGYAILVKDSAIATSSTLKRRWVGGNHLIDVRTAQSIKKDIEVSVICESGWEAETLAKSVLLSEGERREYFLSLCSGWVVN